MPESAKKTKKTKQPDVAAAPAGKRVDVHHLTRVEGHGNIVVEIDKDDKVQTCRWEVPEAPRFFEAMILGRPFHDVHWIVSRICGICSIGHQLSSLQATEEALGVEVSSQTILLRKLALHAENLQSHLLHIGYLVLPDLVGAGSVIPMASTHKDELLGLIGLRRLSNDFSRVVCGRTTHPQRMVVGGFAKLPEPAELSELRGRLEASLADYDKAVKLFASLMDKVPDFKRPTEYVGLVSPVEYALLWGEVGSSVDMKKPARFYKDMTKEYLVPQSTAKWSKNAAESVMVGALARFNLNHDKLSPRAKHAAKELGLVAPCHNSFMNTIAQLVECVHSTEDSMALIDTLLEHGLEDEGLYEITPRAGKGTGAVEVPRGILFHHYEYDEHGRVVDADCVIPTNQNHANIQKDLEALVPTLAGKSEKDIELITSMLVRAYDPCISCSTHLIDARPAPEGVTDRGVRFVRK